MQWDEFADWGKQIADWAADYHQTLRDRPVRAVYTSPLIRSAETAQAIAAAGNGSPSQGPRLVTSSSRAKGSWLSDLARISACTTLPGITTGRSWRQ